MQRHPNCLPSSCPAQELAIETSLGNIAATWAELQLDMAAYKSTYKLRSTEDVFAALEDNGVTLSTMKASKYYLVFEQQVGHWERTLALASETVEMVLQVRECCQVILILKPGSLLCHWRKMLDGHTAGLVEKRMRKRWHYSACLQEGGACCQ